MWGGMGKETYRVKPWKLSYAYFVVVLHLNYSELKFEVYIIKNY